MKSEKLYDAITEIKDEFIEQAGEYNFRKQYYRTLIVRWGSFAAACFVLFALGTAGINSLRCGSSAPNENSSAPTMETESILEESKAEGGFFEDTIQVLAYNGSLYNCSNSLEVLSPAGIEERMTEETCGAWLGNLKRTSFGYEPTTMETDIALYQYDEAVSNEAVMVIRDGEEYMAGLFSNYRGFNETAYAELEQLYRTYGITKPEHMVSVAEREAVAADFSNVYRESVTEKAALAEFYQLSLETFNEWGSAFDKDTFYEFFLTKQMTAEEYETAEELLAADERTLCIETAEGLKFYLSYYPTYGWLYSENATAYFPVEENLKNWFETYLQIH